jgi:hypothetical protein
MDRLEPEKIALDFAGEKSPPDYWAYEVALARHGMIAALEWVWNTGYYLDGAGVLLRAELDRLRKERDE